jgi:acetyltransferase-like isoleucine patch superfamily enzyme
MLHLQNLLRRCIDLNVPCLLRAMLHKRGLRLGKGVSFAGLPIVAIAPMSQIQIGDWSRLISRCEATALGVNHPVILRTLKPGAAIVLGKGVRVSGLTVCAANRVTIGDRAVIGANVTIADTDFHSLDSETRSTFRDSDFARNAPVDIGPDVFIGAGVYVLKGVKIGARAVIGAASVVTRDLPPDSIAAGNPATIIGKVGAQTIPGRVAQASAPRQSGADVLPADCANVSPSSPSLTRHR